MNDSACVRVAVDQLPPPLRPPVHYRELFEEALVGIYVSRPDGTLLSCNAAFARMLGFASVAEAVGAAMSTVYDNVLERDRFVASVREHGRLEHHRARLRRAGGGVVDVIEAVVGEFDSEGALVELRGFLIDVTTTVEAELAMHERDRQFRSVFFDAADAMLILDDHRRIIEANPAACVLFGVPSEAVVEHALDGLILDAESLAAAWREVLALGEAQHEHRVRARGGGVRVVECNYRARVHGHRHLCIARDITDRRLIEERLVQAEKIESVGRLAGGIAHDFNNLLTAILGYTELLLASRPFDDPDRRDLEEIQKAGQRAAGLTQQLLAFSRKQVLMPKEVDLNQTITGLKTMLCHLIREDIMLVCDPAPAPAVVRIDPAQIEQVLLNLVLNARDALPGGGVIRLHVSHVARPAVGAPADQPLAPAEQYVRLSVSDNGVGMSAEARSHLFEPFFTTKDVGKGTGLGLASVYGIVRQSNGIITADSEPGAGSVFTMYFPVASASAAGGAASSSPTGMHDGARETILLVEDEDAVRVIVSTVLRRQGYHVLEAATPTVAISIFARHNGAINMLLTDVVMPEMSGPALAQRLIGLRPELRVLFISGYADVAMQPQFGGANVSFLSKPFQASVLTARVAQLLGTGAQLRS
jgi:two-component system, cell cycle sensor histidine kinase and response regulator CckA